MGEKPVDRSHSWSHPVCRGRRFRGRARGFRGFRWLLRSVTINVILLGTAACAPRPLNVQALDPAADLRILADVEARLAAEPAIAAERIRVEVRDGRVHLHGSIDGIGAWRCAIRTASLVDEVRSVVDFLVIDPGRPEVVCLAPR